MIQFAMEHPISTVIIVLIVMGFTRDIHAVWAEAYAAKKEKEDAS